MRVAFAPELHKNFDFRDFLLKKYKRRPFIGRAVCFGNKDTTHIHEVGF